MYFIFAVVVAVLLLLWAAVRSRRARISNPEAAQRAIVPIDIDAFRNLVDRSEETYLRRELTPEDFRAVQRARYIATAEYLRRVAKNAGVILRLSESARLSHSEAVEREGAEMASAAATLRLLCMIGVAQAYFGYVFPGLGVSVGRVADVYDRLTAKVWAMHHTWTPVRNAS